MTVTLHAVLAIEGDKSWPIVAYADEDQASSHRDCARLEEARVLTDLGSPRLVPAIVSAAAQDDADRAARLIWQSNPYDRTRRDGPIGTHRTYDLATISAASWSLLRRSLCDAEGRSLIRAELPR